MIEDINNKKSKYNDILNRIHKNNSIFERLIIIKKLYMTNSALYYYFCILFRFIHLLSFSGDYYNSLKRKKTTISIQRFFKKLTLHYILEKCNISFTSYIIIDVIIIVFSIIEFILLFFYINKLKKNEYEKNWHLPDKFLIIYDHINFLLFPYIIEYLSFSYYIFCFSPKFIIKIDSSKDKLVCILFAVINTILIILYNLFNYIGIFCSNKIYTITIFEANLNAKETAKINYNKPIAYRLSIIGFYIITILQNFVIFLTIENYINNNLYKIIIKIIFSITILLCILFFFFNKMNKFNYLNHINSFINILFLLCFYSIVLDFIIFTTKYKISNLLNEIVYAVIKLFISFITYLLFILKSEKFLQNKMTEILFEDKIEKKQKYFINCFYFLHEIMLTIKEKNIIESTFPLIEILSEHTNNCNKTSCNCNLFKAFIRSEKMNKINNEEETKNYISELLILLNYLFESPFINYNYYNNFELSILLAEHFCHLKNNPTAAFSIITTFMLRKRKKCTKFQIVILYELSQKYIYFISAKNNNEDNELSTAKDELIINKSLENTYNTYYYNLNLSNKIKKLFYQYINNILLILKYKNAFEDSLSFKLDENNENIISVKINFFEENTRIENQKSKKRKKIKNYGSNLYNIIYILKLGELYFKKIIDSINKLLETKELEIFILFKSFLFFDIFTGGKIPEENLKKLYRLLLNDINTYNKNISKKEYSILRRKYKEQNNKLNSEIYILVEFKKDLRTKYFTEDAALKLGFKQKDIINESIDILMPKEFSKSHKNSLKYLIIAYQKRYSLSKQSYFFDKTNSILYSADYEGKLIYNISKNLIIILKAHFNLENEYRFMLDSNFDLLASTRNFEDEYYLNKVILREYNINMLNILKLNPEKLKKKFENEFRKIQYQKLIKQIKVQEYFVPQFFSSKENVLNANSSYFNSTKQKFLNKILNYKNKENDDDSISNNNNVDDDKSKFLTKENLTNYIKNIKELFIDPREVVFHKYYYMNLNKGIFIENLAKELIKIPDNDLIMEKDTVNHNLIISAKKFIAKLLTKNELANNSLKISIKFSFYFDKIFYFITIDDQKKLYLKIHKGIHFVNNDFRIKKNSTESLISSKNKIPFNTKSRNKRNINKQISNKSQKNEKIENSILSKPNIKNQGNLNEEKEFDDRFEIIKKIKEYEKKINKTKFISIIKLILTITIICILIISIILISFQNNLLRNMELILLAYFYNLFTKNLLLGIHSIFIHTYYDLYIFKNPDFSNDYRIIRSLGLELKERYHNFTVYFFNYNLEIGKDFNLIYNKKNFTKIRGFWKSIEYESQYSTEFDFVLYNILSLNSTDFLKPEIQIDFENFLFFQGEKKEKEKINSQFINILYYLCENYEFVYKDLYKEIEDSIYNSYMEFYDSKIKLSTSLEIIEILFYAIFFITIIFFLLFSNSIIIKNIIFLFLDFSEKNYDKNKGKNNNVINLKLIELKYIVNDFDLNLFENYSKKLDNINNNRINTNNKIDNADNLNSNMNGSQNINDNESKNSHSKQISMRKKMNENSSIVKEDTFNSNKNSLFSDLKSKISSNNSSHNYLMDSNSQFFKDKLNNNSINASNAMLSTKSIQNNINTKNIIQKKYKNDNDNEDEENIQDIILNKSNKSLVLMIKIFLIVIAILILIVIVFYYIKLNYLTKYNSEYGNYFMDLLILTDRYMQAYHYFNILRTLILFPEGEKKNILKNNMEQMNHLFDIENEKFNRLLSKNIKNYPLVNKLVDIIKYSQNNSTSKIKEPICLDYANCYLYLNSKYNIFDSGVDFTFKATMTQINNIWLNYKQLKDTSNIYSVINEVINSNIQFFYIGLSLNGFYVFIESSLFINFEKDENNFIKSCISFFTLLNLISIIFSILVFLFVIIFIFFSISNFTNPIRDSAYRINSSLYYIKKYSLSNYMKYNSLI